MFEGSDVVVEVEAVEDGPGGICHYESLSFSSVEMKLRLRKKREMVKKRRQASFY